MYTNVGVFCVSRNAGIVKVYRVEPRINARVPTGGIPENMKYTFNIFEEHATREREKIILESREGESDRHIALKVLAYLLFRERSLPLPLRIEQAVGQRHKPDLVAEDESENRIRLWIDCGQIEPKRLGRIAQTNPTADIFVLKSTRAEAETYARAANKDLGHEAKKRDCIRFIGFDAGFLDGFLEALRGTNDLSLVRDWEGPNRATVTLNDWSSATDIEGFAP